MDYRNVCTAVFTPLEYACCGMSEDSANRELGEETRETGASPGTLDQREGGWGGGGGSFPASILDRTRSCTCDENAREYRASSPRPWAKFVWEARWGRLPLLVPETLVLEAGEGGPLPSTRSTISRRVPKMPRTETHRIRGPRHAFEPSRGGGHPGHRVQSSFCGAKRIVRWGTVTRTWERSSATAALSSRDAAAQRGAPSARGDTVPRSVVAATPYQPSQRSRRGRGRPGDRPSLGLHQPCTA